MKVLRKQEIETANIQVGDQVIIPLAEIGEFSATAHKVTDEGIMFIFDEYITRRPMNSKNTNKGGFEKSEPSNGSYDVEPNESDAGADYDSIVNELLDGLEKEIDEIIGSYVSDDEEEP